MKKITISVLSLKRSFRMLFQDKWILLLSLIPVGIGIGMFTWFGAEAVSWGEAQGQEWANSFSWGGEYIRYLVKFVIIFLIAVMVNYTFVLFISVLASPFNDAISSRVANIVVGEQPEAIKETFSRMMKGFVKTILNEAIKISIIIGLSALAFGLSFIPILVPISLGLSALLFASEFLDYSWGRNSQPVKKCASELIVNVVPYLGGGFLMMALVAVPFVNLLVLYSMK